MSDAGEQLPPLEVPEVARAVRVPGSSWGVMEHAPIPHHFEPASSPQEPAGAPPSVPPYIDPPPNRGGLTMPLSALAIVNALLAVVVIAATVAFAYDVRGFTGQDLAGVYLYVLGHASGQLVPTSTTVKPPGA